MGSGDVNQADKSVFGMPVSVFLRACESWPRRRVKIQSDEMSSIKLSSNLLQSAISSVAHHHLNVN